MVYLNMQTTLTLEYFKEHLCRLDMEVVNKLYSKGFKIIQGKGPYASGNIRIYELTLYDDNEIPIANFITIEDLIRVLTLLR